MRSHRITSQHCAYIPNVESFSVFLFWIRFWSLNFSCHKSKALTFSTIRCKLLNLKNQKRVLPKLDLPVKPAKKAKAEKPEAEIANADAIMDDEGGDPAPKAKAKAKAKSGGRPAGGGSGPSVADEAKAALMKKLMANTGQ